MDKFNKCEKDYYIIYFDILGYKQYFEENENHQQLLHDIIKMLQEVHDLKWSFKALTDKMIKVRAFSDNIIIALESKEYKGFDLFCFLIAYIQAELLIKYGLLVRGAFTKGNFYINTRIVYGEGLIKAVQLENKAKYPRIIIDNEVFCKETNYHLLRKYCSEDMDGEIYLNYFDRRYIVDKFSCLKEKIAQKIKKYGKYPPNIKDENKIKVYESIIQKTLWVVEKFNDACDAIGNPEEKIDYKVTINKRLLKMELSLAEKA